MESNVTVAIDVKPELGFRESFGKFYYSLDSGETDLNRLISSNSLDELSIADIQITGFKDYLLFKSQAEVDEFVKQKKRKSLSGGLGDNTDTSTSIEIAKKSSEPVHVKPVEFTKEVKLDDDTTFALVEGTVSLLLGNGNLVYLAHPVYRVYPDKKGGLLDIELINSYVSTQWTDKIRDSLFSIASSDNTSADGSLIKTTKNATSKSGAISPSTLKTLERVAVVLILLGILYFIYSLVSVGKTNQVATGANENVNMLALQEAGIATAPVTTTLSPQEATAENLAKVQAQQTEEMLKKMGVDLSASEQDLGCFVEGG